MNTGETLITLGALTLLLIVIINMNKTLNTTDTYLNETRFGLEKIALATSLIEEISQYPFDEASWDTVKIEKVPADFTAAADLGPESDETVDTLYDDVDDFDDYSRVVSTQQNSYNIECNVNYVADGAPNTDITTQSFFKKITVSVYNPQFSDTTTIAYIHGFWFFN